MRVRTRALGRTWTWTYSEPIRVARMGTPGEFEEPPPPPPETRVMCQAIGERSVTS